MSPPKATVAVVGGGAAAVSAAMWLRSLHVRCAWFSGEAGLGGMLHHVSNPIANFPPGHFEDGDALAASFDEFVAEHDLEPVRRRVDGIRKTETGFELELGDDVEAVGAVIVATGTRYRTLNVPGEEAGLGRWVSQSAAADAERFAGSDVLVVGGGDAAFENALRLSAVGCTVSMAIRSAEFRARNAFVQRVKDDPAVTILPIPTVVEAIHEADRGCMVDLRLAGAIEKRPFAGVFVRIGVEAVVPLLPDEVRHLGGYLSVDTRGQTSVPGLFAAGDVTDTILRSVATSVGDGARCARAAAEFIGAFYDS